MKRLRHILGHWLLRDAPKPVAHLVYDGTGIKAAIATEPTTLVQNNTITDATAADIERALLRLRRRRGLAS